jgi:hypothetical protein
MATYAFNGGRSYGSHNMVIRIWTDSFGNTHYHYTPEQKEKPKKLYKRF